MGIKGLSTFINDNFDGWSILNESELKHLVIDGNNVCYKLFTKYLCWSLGGDYSEFADRVKEYFEGIQRSGIEPIVILDGIDHDGSKMETVRERK